MKITVLTFRKFEPRDFEDYFLLVGNAQVMAKITERALQKDEAKEDYENRLSRNSIAENYGYYKITEAASGAFIGLAKLEVEQADSNEAEVGYILLPEYWGQGIGSRVVKQLIDRALRLPELDRLFAIIDPDNIPSRKILTNNGFVSKTFRDFDGLPGELLVLDFNRSK